MTLQSRTRFQACTVGAVLGLTALGTGTGTVMNPADAAPISTSAPAADPRKDPVAMEKAFIALWNEQRFDEILGYYAEDALFAPPNHDLIRGPAAIIAYMKTLRPLLGQLKAGLEPHRVVKSGKVTPPTQ